MDSEEFKKLMEAGAEADEQLRIFQKMQAEYQPAKPLEVTPYDPYIDSDDFKRGIQAIQEIREVQEAERQSRIESEKRAEKVNRKQALETRIWNTIIVAIGLLTLAATIYGTLK